MPYLTYPGNGQGHPKLNQPFTWTNDVGAYSFKLYVGTAPGSGNIYTGSETQGLQNSVSNLPGGNKLCYGRVRYRMTGGGPWYWGQITSFTCQ